MFQISWRCTYVGSRPRIERGLNVVVCHLGDDNPDVLSVMRGSDDVGANTIRAGVSVHHSALYNGFAVLSCPKWLGHPATTNGCILALKAAILSKVYTLDGCLNTVPPNHREVTESKSTHNTQIEET